MPSRSACVWCLRTVRLPDNYSGQEVACCKECATKEREFQRLHNDEQIGLRNYRDHGINPNHLKQPPKRVR